jgi:hypothetical protein
VRIGATGDLELWQEYLLLPYIIPKVDNHARLLLKHARDKWE